MRSLQAEIEFFEQNEAGFKTDHFQEWIVISGRKVLGFFDKFEQVSECLRQHYNPAAPDTAFLVRQIGVKPHGSHRIQFATV